MAPTLAHLLADESLDPSAEVWRYDTGGYFVGEPDSDDEASFVGTVQELRDEMAQLAYDDE